MPTLDDLAALAASHLSSISPSTLSDDELLEAQRRLGECQRLVESASAVVAAEVQHRSRRELGYGGLAQRHGLRTAEALVQQVAGTNRGSARRLVRVGTVVVGTAEPWLSSVTSRFREGAVSAEGLDVIRGGLGAPSDDVPMDALARAAHDLALLAPTVTIERLAALARERRDELDAAGVSGREQRRRDRRYLRITPLPDGMTRLTGLLDPESAAIVVASLDAATSPRRGGPRFLDPGDIARAVQLERDERTVDQLMLDAFVELVDVATRGRASHVLGSRRPAARVLVTQRDLASGAGAAHLEGQTAAVSIPTVERLSCEGGVQRVLLGASGEVLDLGRTERLHSASQRRAIAARDSGCVFPECDRPVSWTEVHHIVPWSEGGRTSVADGVLLCRHHHLLLHNNGWRIRRSDHEYWLHSPPGIQRGPVRLTTKSPAMRRVLQWA